MVRTHAHAIALILVLAPIAAFAAEPGSQCALRKAGAQGLSGAVVGHVDAGGKCVETAPPKVKKKADDGLEASAQCKDLSFSYSRQRASACAKHGGVLEWLAQD